LPEGRPCEEEAWRTSQWSDREFSFAEASEVRATSRSAQDRGDVEVAGEVTIGDGALVKADVTARRITVRGAVAGNLTGEDGVRLEEGARVVGDVKGASIGISEGACSEATYRLATARKPRRAARRAAARPAVRTETRKAPVVAATRGNGATRRAAESEERAGPPPPVVPALKKGARAALRKRSR